MPDTVLDTGIEDEHDAFPARRSAQPRGERGLSTGKLQRRSVCWHPSGSSGLWGLREGALTLLGKAGRKEGIVRSWKTKLW